MAFWTCLKLFTKWVVPDADGSQIASKKLSFFTGVHKDALQAQRQGWLKARSEFCACSACMLGRYDQCALESEHGRVRTYKVPAIDGGRSKPQILELQEWAAALCAGMIVIFAADDSDIAMEGCYWLARLRSAAFSCPATMAHASDQVEEGWLVVKAQW